MSEPPEPGPALWDAVDAYFESRLILADAAMEAALTGSRAAGLPAIHVSASQGKLLQLLAETQRAQRILEVGTLGGYSTLWLARALPSSGRVVTLELNPQYATVARQNFERAGVSGQVEVRVGPARDSLRLLIEKGAGPFDLVFIDADKPNNLNYVRAALALSRPGTLIVVDNVVRGGQVIHAGHDASVDGVRELVEWMVTEPRLTATAIQTVGNKGYDGFLLARVNTGP